MNIFLTNDDGIEAQGIRTLAMVAVERGHNVFMCAPRTQQSAASHRITLVEPVYANPYPLPDVHAYAIGGTPADCVRVGLQEIFSNEKMDIVISGINHGLNAGMATHYSGTFSAAMEGAMHRVCSVSTSMHEKADPAQFLPFARYTLAMAEKYHAMERKPFTVLNINAPKHDDCFTREPVYAPLSQRPFTDCYTHRESPRAGSYYWLDKNSLQEPIPAQSDEEYLRRGYITLTLVGPLQSYECDNTLFS